MNAANRISPGPTKRTTGLRTACAACLVAASMGCGAAAAEKPVRVFLLAGQSNMQGQGVVEMDHPKYYNGGKGNLVHVMKHAKDPKRYAHLKDARGNWTVRDDVWVRYRLDAKRVMAGALSVGFTCYGGKSHIGPELQIGHRLGDRLDEPVLLIKTAWGGKSLYKDFRPPSAGGKTGDYYIKMLEEVTEALSSIGTEFPKLKGRRTEMSGFIWFQGWNDMISDQGRRQYAANLVHLIQDVRKAFKKPSLPVVIGELGNGGPKAGKSMMAIRKAQAAAAAHPTFKGTVRFVETTAFARPADESPNRTHGHHWFGNAGSYFLIGDALGAAMVDLLKE